MRVVWPTRQRMSALERGVDGEGVGRVRSTSESLALHAWLGQELEVRGIDAMIYTRYILSLLQQEWPDLEEEVAAVTLAKKNNAARPSHLLSRHARKKRHGSIPLVLSAEKIKKLAAIQCLLDVSEEDSGIEKLVEELYSKLQQQEHQDTCNKIECRDESHHHKHFDEDLRVKSEDCDPAERYYAAFPALSKDTEAPKRATVPEGKPWAKVAGSSPRTTDTSQDKPDAKYTRGCSSSPNNPTYRRKPVFVVPKVITGRSKSEARSIGGASPVRDPDYKPTSQEWIANLWETFNGKMWLERVMQMMRSAGEVTELKEDMSWYTQPLEMLVPQSPLTSQRLYKRKSHPVFYFDFRFSLQDEDGDSNSEAGDAYDGDSSLARYISQLKRRLELELYEEEKENYYLREEDEHEDDDDSFVPVPTEFMYDEVDRDRSPTPTNEVCEATVSSEVSSGVSAGFGVSDAVTGGKSLPSPPVAVTLNISHCSSAADLELTPRADENTPWALNSSFTENSDTEEALEKGFKKAKEAEEAFNRVKQLEETKKLEEAKQSHEAEIKLTGRSKEDNEAHILALEENVLNKCKETILDQALEEVLNVVEETEDQGPEDVMKSTFEDVTIAMENEVFISCPDPFFSGDPTKTTVSHTDEYLLISRAKEAEEAFNKVKWAEEAFGPVPKITKVPKERRDHENCLGIIVSSGGGCELRADSYPKSPRLSSGSDSGQDWSPRLSTNLNNDSTDGTEIQDDWETSIKAAIQGAFNSSSDNINEAEADAKTHNGIDKIFNMGQKDLSSSSLFDYSGFSDDFPNIGVLDSRYSEEEGTGSLSAAVEAAFHRVDSMSDSINLETTSCSLDEDDDDIDLNISKLWQMSSPMEDRGDMKYKREPHDRMKYTRQEEEDREDILNVRPIFMVGDDADVYSPPASLRNSPMHPEPVNSVLSSEFYHPLSLELDLARQMYFPCEQSPMHMWLPMLNCEICLGTCNCQVTWENCLDVLGKRITPWGNRATPWGQRSTPWTPVMHGSLFGPLCNPDYVLDDDYSQSLSHSLNMLLSPNQDGRLTSQLWDVNVQVQGRFDFEPHAWESSSTLDNIQKYLFNLNISIQESAASSFIQGGLYDSSLLPEAAIWQQRVDMDDLFTFMDEAWQSSRHDHGNSSSLESLDQLDPPLEQSLRCIECPHGPSDVRSIQHHRIKLTTESLNFIPSENTAFTASIPSRNAAALPHVHSEPILNRRRLRAPPAAKTLQVKLLHKSDTNIFSQLGMVAPVGISCIEVAPNSHYRPIRTPFDGQQVDPNAFKTEDVVSPLSEEEAWRMLGRKSNYQFFRHYIEPEEDEFIPKFKVEKERDMCTQTENDYYNTNVLETMFTSDIQSELEISPADAERLVEKDCKSYDCFSESRESPEVSSDYESMGADMSSEDLSGLPLAQLWSGEEEEGISDQTSEGNQNFSSIWSYAGVPGGLPLVPKSSLVNNLVNNFSDRQSSDRDSVSSAFQSGGGKVTRESHSSSFTRVKSDDGVSDTAVVMDTARNTNSLNNSDIIDATDKSELDKDTKSGGKVAVANQVAIQVANQVANQVSFIRLGKMESQPSKTDYNVVLELEGSLPEAGHSRTRWSTADDDDDPVEKYVEAGCCGHSENKHLENALCYFDDVMQIEPIEQTQLKQLAHLNQQRNGLKGTSAMSSATSSTVASHSSDAHININKKDCHKNSDPGKKVTKPRKKESETSAVASSRTSDRNSDRNSNQKQQLPTGAASLLLGANDGEKEEQLVNGYELEPGAQQQLSATSPGIQCNSNKRGSSKGSGVKEPVGKDPSCSSKHAQQEMGQLPVYSSDLEKQWLSTESSFAVQVPKPGQRHRLGSRQKPCSFYLEGNCRRVDCKFAHDTSNITCRFWEEGACFKGITCPFLHGYYKDKGSPKSEDLDNFYIADTEFPELVQLHNKKEEERSSSHTSEDSESAVPVIHRRKQQKSLMKGQHGKFQKNKGT